MKKIILISLVIILLLAGIALAAMNNVTVTDNNMNTTVSFPDVVNLGQEYIGQNLKAYNIIVGNITNSSMAISIYLFPTGSQITSDDTIFWVQSPLTQTIYPLSTTQSVAINPSSEAGNYTIFLKAKRVGNLNATIGIQCSSCNATNGNIGSTVLTARFAGDVIVPNDTDLGYQNIGSSIQVFNISISNATIPFRIRIDNGTLINNNATVFWLQTPVTATPYSITGDWLNITISEPGNYSVYYKSRTVGNLNALFEVGCDNCNINKNYVNLSARFIGQLIAPDRANANNQQINDEFAWFTIQSLNPTIPIRIIWMNGTSTNLVDTYLIDPAGTRTRLDFNYIDRIVIPSSLVGNYTIVGRSGDVLGSPRGYIRVECSFCNISDSGSV
jgi:hypothetical protein